MTSLIAVEGGAVGTAAVIVLLLVGAWVIIRQAGHNRVDFSNVNDADSVVVAKQHDPELGGRLRPSMRSRRSLSARPPRLLRQQRQPQRQRQFR